MPGVRLVGRAGSPACRYGAVAAAWSRSASVTSFGLSGLPVAHAGHWSWQRPHSVHVEKSSRPFHVKSSIAPTPEAGVVGKVLQRREVDGLSGQRHRLEGPERDAAARVAARVHVDDGEEPVPRDAHRGLQPDDDEPRHRHDDLHGRDDDDAVSSVVGATPIHDAPNHAVSGKCHASAGAQRVLQRRAARSRTARPPARCASTKNACPWFDPKNREPAVPASPSRSRSTISATMPTQRQPRDRLDRPLQRREVPDQRQRERRVDHLPVPGDQREEQQRERDHHDPVRDLDHRPVLEPPVPEHLPRSASPAAVPTGVHRPPAAPARPARSARSRAHRARTRATPTTVATTTITEAHHLQRIHARHASGAGAARATAPAARPPAGRDSSPSVASRNVAASSAVELHELGGGRGRPGRRGGRGCGGSDAAGRAAAGRAVGGGVGNRLVES